VPTYWLNRIATVGVAGVVGRWGWQVLYTLSSES
jgi:hypothetical protein